MEAYWTMEPRWDRCSDIEYFWLSAPSWYPCRQYVDNDTDPKHILLIRSDYKFAMYCNKVYRVCEISIDDFNDAPFIKVWINDPFKDFPDYEQISTDNL